MQTMVIEVSKLTGNVNILRASDVDEELSELANSISRVGLLNPLAVVAADDGFVVVAGHRRLAAIKMCGIKEVPCIIFKSDGATTAEMSLAENLFRKDLTPIETAAAVCDVIEHEIMGVEQIALAMHRSVQWVKLQQCICAWPPDVTEAVHRGCMSVSAALNLAEITNNVYRAQLISYAIENGATARTTAAWLQAWQSSKPPEAAIEAEPAAGRPAESPLTPYLPCLCCGEKLRSDALVHMPMCPRCVSSIRDAQAQG